MKATRISLVLTFCASLAILCIILIWTQSVTSWSSPKNFQGYSLDKDNILFDGRGEFDYLRGERRAGIKGDRDDANNFRPDVNANKSDVRIFSGKIHYQYTNIDDVKTDTSLSYLHCNTRYSFSKELKSQALQGWVSPPPNLPTSFPKTIFNEILLLHEVSKPALDWSDSGILHELCIDGLSAVLAVEKNNERRYNEGAGEQQQPYVSVTVIDFDPHASGLELHHALQNLEKSSILSGQPLIVVTPVESGKTVISLGAYASEVVPEAEFVGQDRYEAASVQEEVVPVNNDQNTIISHEAGLEGNGKKLNGVTLHSPTEPGSNVRRRLQKSSESDFTGTLLLTHMVKTWISIAPIDALESSGEALRAFLLADINVLSIYSTHDVWGKRAAERLYLSSGARNVELDGDYIENPEKFVEIISDFLY